MWNQDVSSIRPTLYFQVSMYFIFLVAIYIYLSLSLCIYIYINTGVAFIVGEGGWLDCSRIIASFLKGDYHCAKTEWPCNDLRVNMNIWCMVKRIVPMDKHGLFPHDMSRICPAPYLWGKQIFRKTKRVWTHSCGSSSPMVYHRWYGIKRDQNHPKKIEDLETFNHMSAALIRS